MSLVAPASALARPATASRRPSGRLHTVCATRLNVSVAVDSEGEGPWSGRRVPPPTVVLDRSPGPADKFELLSAEEMESKFPEWIHTSSPPTIVDREPPGITALRTMAEGPTTGHRRRPSVSTSRATGSPLLPYPGFDLQRDLAAKKKIFGSP